MNDTDQSELVIVGRVGGAFGVRGWVRLVSFTDPPRNLLDYSPWFLQQGNKPWQKVDVREVKSHQKGFVAAFAGVVGREEAQKLTGSSIGVPAQALPETASGEYYWRDLIGLDVFDSSGARIGIVDHLLQSPAHDVLVVKTAQGEVLIPYVEQFVSEINIEDRRMTVDWLDS
jgi:16S rRNA processing protein RimM